MAEQAQVNGRTYRRPPSHVPCESSRPGSRRLHAGHHLASTRAPARLILGTASESPVSMPPCSLTTIPRRLPARSPPPGISGTSSWSLPDASGAPFSLSLTTTVFSQRSTGWFDACPRRPTPEGHSSISHTAPFPKVPTYHPPSTFVTHEARKATLDDLFGIIDSIMRISRHFRVAHESGFHLVCRSVRRANWWRSSGTARNVTTATSQSRQTASVRTPRPRR